MQRPNHEESSTFNRATLAYIQQAADCGCTISAGWGPSGRCHVRRSGLSHRLALAVSVGRISRTLRRPKPCSGTRHAKRPIELEIPITVAGMSFGALSANVKEAIGRAATALGTSTTTGDGGMTPEERESSKTLVYQCLPVALRIQSRRSAQGRRHRDRHRPGGQAGRRRNVAGAKGQSARRRHADACPRESISARPAGIRIGPARTTWRSRSRNCGRSPTGKCRST